MFQFFIRGVKRAPLSSLLLLQVSGTVGYTQISLQALSETRYGELPQGGSESIPTFYSDLSSEFRWQWLLTGARVEGFNSPDLSLHYEQLSQRYLEASWRWGAARIGNSYGILGRGLLLRSFELPAFIHEDPRLRRRHSVIRDFDGVRLSLAPGPVNLLVLGGEPALDPLAPPSDDNRPRRFGRVAGAQLGIRIPAGIEIGGAYLRLNDGSAERKDYAARFVNGSLSPALAALGMNELGLDLYAEYATRQGGNAFGKLDRTSPHALFGAAVLSYGSAGLSFEYKDYRDFNLGVNDPPSLVRQSTEVLLNRGTHVLLLEAENGYQVELAVVPARRTRLTINLSAAENDFGPDLPSYEFWQRYISLNYGGDPLDAKLFADFSNNSIEGDRRFTAGTGVDRSLPSGLILGAELQWQQVHRVVPGLIDAYFANATSEARIQGWKNLTMYFRLERSAEPDLRFSAGEPEVTTKIVYWPGGGIGWKPMAQIETQFFVGKRLGGLFCDHGYCIEVPSYQGAELRFLARL